MRLSSVALTISLVALTLSTPGPPAAQASAGGSPPDVVTMVDSTGASWTIEVPTTTRRDSGPTASVPATTGSGDLADLVGAELYPVLPPEVARALAPEERQAGTRSVIGADDRTRITKVTSDPYVQMPLLTYAKPGGDRFMCTGWLYDNRTLATAAHCLSDGEGTWYSGYEVYFGADGSSAYARCGYNVQAAPVGWDGVAGSPHDWGILVLNCNAGDVLGHLGYKSLSTAPSGNWSVTGYPSDKVSSTSGYTMWTHSGPVTAADAARWHYQIDTHGGQSGAPVWRLEAGTSCGNCAIGIHVAGPLNPTPTSKNTGVRITATVFEALSAYARAYP